MRSYRIIHIPSYQTGNPYQRLLLDNLKRFRLDVRHGRIVEFFSMVNISVLFNVVRNFRVDIIHLHWLHPFLIGNSRVKTIVKSLLFISQLLIVKIFGIKLVWTVHNLKNHENRYTETELLFSRVVAQLADAIIAHCEAAKQDIQRVFNVRRKDKIVVIPHGSYSNVYKNTISQEEARNRLNLLPTDLTFLFLGKIRPYKGALELIDSFRKLENNYAKLIIAGKPRPQLVELLRKKAEGDSNIRLILSFIPDDEIQIYMNAADIMILPYRDILTSGAVILGMSFGKAIIAPYLGCIPEILDSSGSFFYDPDEQDGLLNVMKRAMVSRARLREMGNYNLGLGEKPDWRDIAASTYRVYKRCLNR
jgi:glycosyltransferase involved in cell wall biosynthesis